MLKLCFKEYDTKMSLGAMKKFNQATDKDLWHLLISFIEVFAQTQEVNIITRMKLLLNVCDFETASHAFHCMIEDSSIPLNEVQDGMFRVGWMPTDDESGLSEPWPLIMVKLAYDVDKQFNNVQGKKKGMGISEQSQEKAS